MSDFQKTEEYQKMKEYIEYLQMENEKLQCENRMWEQKCQAIQESFRRKYQGVGERFYDLEQTIDQLNKKIERLFEENQNCKEKIEDLRAERYRLLEYRDRIEAVREIVNCN